MLNPNTKKNMMNAMGDVRPSHLLDVGLRQACGLDSITGKIVEVERAGLVKGYETTTIQKRTLDQVRVTVKTLRFSHYLDLKAYFKSF